MSEAMFYQLIGNSIQANKDKIEKLEKQNARLKKQKKVLQQESKQLKDNWNDLKKYAKEVISTDNELYGTDLLDKMQELEGSDSNEKRM